MNFLVNFYFGLGVFFSLLGLIYFNSPSRIIGTPDERSVSELSSYLLSSVFLRIPYMIWIILGFLSSQWFLFLVLIGLTGVLFVLHEVLDSDLVKGYILNISIVFEFFMVGFICLNHFHLGINVLDII